jgi:hypothetical protein
MTTLAAEEVVSFFAAFGNSLGSFIVETWSQQDVSSRTPTELERTRARRQMRLMARRARALVGSTPDYPDSDERRAEREEITRAFGEWQDEAIRDS